MSRRRGRTEPPPGSWEHKISRPKPAVTAFERADRDQVVYVRWWDGAGGRYQKASLGIRIRDEAGRILRAAEEEAIRKASLVHMSLAAGEGPVGGVSTGRAQALTIHAGIARILHPETGLYPASTDRAARNLRRDMVRAGRLIREVFTEAETFEGTPALLAAERTWRHFAREHQSSGRGYRTAERAVDLLLRSADWLAERGYIPPTTWIRPRGWRLRLKEEWRRLTSVVAETKTDKLRHGEEEVARLLAAAEEPDVDPRIRLLVRLAFGARLGQVIQCRRSDLTLKGGAWGLGHLEVRGSVKKPGVAISLAPDIRAEVDLVLTEGYLRELEAAYRSGDLEDYPLFPAHRLHRGIAPLRPPLKPMSSTKLNRGFRTLEGAAGVPHLRGRGTYGLRRTMVDRMSKLHLPPRTREALAGWTHGSRMAAIYEKQAQEADRHEASEARQAIVRGLSGKGGPAQDIKAGGDEPTETVGPGARSDSRETP